jgi:hypothetical protein
MKRSLFVGAFLIVEGVADKRTYGLAIDHEACKIEIAYGRSNVLGAMLILNDAGFPGVLAIIDADVDRLTGGMPSSHSNVLRTDLHDLECMILNSPAFDRVLEEFGSEERIEQFSVRRGALVARELAVSAIPLGCLRLISIRDDLGLRFEGLAFSRFVEVSDLRIDVTEMVRDVVNKSQKHHLDQKRLVELVSCEMQKGHDCWQVSCGHDIVELLSRAFRKTFRGDSSGEVDPERLERSLRLAYGVTDLRNTSLFQALQDWERGNLCYPILAET